MKKLFLILSVVGALSLSTVNVFAQDAEEAAFEQVDRKSVV